jgi:hypothetical protein
VYSSPENVPLPDLAGKTIQRIVLIEDEEAEWLNAAPAATVDGVPSVGFSTAC